MSTKIPLTNGTPGVGSCLGSISNMNFGFVPPGNSYTQVGFKYSASTMTSETPRKLYNSKERGCFDAIWMQVSMG